MTRARDWSRTAQSGRNTSRREADLEICDEQAWNATLAIVTLLAAAVMLLATVGSAHAHALRYRVTEGPAITVQLYFPDNGAAQFQPYEVFAPQGTGAHQAGRVNARGEVTFRPDRPGEWRVAIITADGHGVDARIDVEADLSASAASLAPPTSWWQRVSVGLGYVLGIFGLLALWRLRRSAGKQA